MVNDSNNMKDDVRKVAADAVRAKFASLMAERERVISEMAEVERRLRNIDRGLMDCRAAGRLFDVDVVLPDDVRWRIATTQRFYGGGSTERSGRAAAPQPKPDKPVDALIQEVIGHVEPSIRDLVVDQLKSAGAAGIKAAEIRRHVEAVLNRQIHYKTIGMTLYRLTNATPPLARRNGITWFFVPPEAGNEEPRRYRAGA